MTRGWKSVRAAFLAPANLIGLGSAFTASLVVHEGSAAGVALAVEAVYLGLFSFIPRLRRALRSGERRLSPEREIQALLEELAPSQREHYLALRSLRDKIERNYRKLPGGRVLAESSEQRVDALLTVFLRLLGSLNHYRAFLSTADRSGVDRELASVREELGQESSARLHDVKVRRADILEKRLARFTQADESREIVSHQLAGIEDLLRLTHEQSIAIRDPESVTQQLDALSAELEATQETVREMERFVAFNEENAAPLAHGGRVRS